jgi:hypothetical protein
MSRHGVLLVAALLPLALLADRPPAPLSIEADQGQLRVALPEHPIAPVAGMHYRLWMEVSPDLHHWQTAGELAPDDRGQLVFPSGGEALRFHRLRAEIEDSRVAAEAVNGAGIFGFDRVFEEELRRIGLVTPAEFAVEHGAPGPYLDALGFDPRTALYWDQFNADPSVVNEGKEFEAPGWRSFDFRLNPAELGLFLQNGFVVSEALGSYSFAEVFYRIFNDDLPVFVSADSVLHAWHFSYQHLLSELEESVLRRLLVDILDGLAARLAQVPEVVRHGPLQANLEDADYFLAVARSLLSEQLIEPVLGANPHVAVTLQAIESRQLEPEFPMFGGTRRIDFSQFEARSYYTRSSQLSTYFRAMMWGARADLRVFDGPADGPTPMPQSLRELGTAVALALLLRQEANDPLAEKWAAFDAVIRLFVGRADAMHFAQLTPLLDAAGINSLAAVDSPERIANLQRAIAGGTLGLQLIPGDSHLSPLGPAQTQLPRAFSFNAQRFVPDGWALAQVTYDRVGWPEEIPGVTLDGKVLRRMGSAVDVAFSVLGNRSTGDLIAQRMLAPREAGDFRDGLPYAHNLLAVAATIDRTTMAGWEDSIATRWLWALRALSEPVTGPEFPEAMRTRAWARRTLNTQLASYAELKHDTLLYAKQPYAAEFICEYPAGFVEPVPAFWERMAALADATAAGLSQPELTQAATGTVGFLSSEFQWIEVDLAERHQARLTFCVSFAGTMRTLAALARKELRQEPFTADDILFIQGLMNRQDHEYVGPTFDGWYPDLFYTDYALAVGTADMNGSNQADALVADVFTAPPDLVDPVGGVLHQATGNVDLLLIAVDNGPDRMVYAGPVMSYYEFVEPGPALKRWTVEEWKSRLDQAPPPRPEWTGIYLAPSF